MLNKIFKLDKLKNHNDGFTLVEVMVAVGIGTIVTLGVTSMLQNTGKLQIESRAQLEKTQLSLLFDSILIDPLDCTQTILEADPGLPEDNPIPADRLYADEIESTDRRNLVALRRVNSTGAVVDIINLTTLPISIGDQLNPAGEPGPGQKSRVSITEAYLTNFRVLSNAKIYDPDSTAPEFETRDEIDVPSSASYDLVIGLQTSVMGVKDGDAQIVKKNYIINKLVPVSLALERPNNVYNKRSYVSGCQGTEDIRTDNIDKYICDNLGGGSMIREYSANTPPSLTWGESSYVDCKDIVSVRKRALKMTMCKEVGGIWDGVNHVCENRRFEQIMGQECPPGLVVYSVNPNEFNTDDFEPLPNPPGDLKVEKVECRQPCHVGPIGSGNSINCYEQATM